MPAAKIAKLSSASTVAGAAIWGAFALATPPAHAQGWNVDQGTTPSIGASGSWALTYQGNLGGAMFGLGACGGGSFMANLSYATFSCTGFYGSSAGSGQVVRNNAHSIASTQCYGATTWVYTNAVGDYNWVNARRWGTLNSVLANNEASAGRGNLC
jgi:hypothetical protein